jgi:uncharacterized membrane protein YdbT with pleckstrin-like domain
MNNEPLREIRPVVVPAQYYLWGPLISFGVALFTGVFVGGLYTAWSDPFNPAKESSVFHPGIIVFFLVFSVAMVLIYLQVFFGPAKTRYTIFPDRVEYDEGLWTRHRRTLVFDQVIDVELTESVLQQTRAAGTVTLVTRQLVSGANNQLANQRVALRNVPEPKDVYELLRSLALKKTKAEPDPAADRPREDGSSSHNVKPA